VGGGNHLNWKQQLKRIQRPVYKNMILPLGVNFDP
jgi:hypothetical protein